MLSSSAPNPPRWIHTRGSSVTIFIRTASQWGQRRTSPAPRYTWIAPTASVAPQVPHVPIAFVISTVNTSSSRPATAFPSSINASISSSRRSEALDPDPKRLVAERDERLRGRLRERRGATHVDLRALCRHRPHLRQHAGV